MSVDEVLACSLDRIPAKHAVVTGGEADDHSAGYRRAYRTSSVGLGCTSRSKRRGRVFQPVACDPDEHRVPSSRTRHRMSATVASGRHSMSGFAISLKCSDSLCVGIRVISLSSWCALPEDMLAEIAKMIEDLQADRPSRVVLMAEGTRSEVIRERASQLLDICKREGFRYSPRLHIDLWGNRRGV